MNLKDLFEGLTKKDSDSTRKIVKRIPMKKEWIALRNEIEGYKEKVEDIYLTVDRLKRKFWFMIEEDTDLSADMRINAKTNEVEVLEKQSLAAADEDDE
jgi:hypothetical protein